MSWQWTDPGSPWHTKISTYFSFTYLQASWSSLIQAGLSYVRVYPSGWVQLFPCVPHPFGKATQSIFLLWWEVEHKTITVYASVRITSDNIHLIKVKHMAKIQIKSGKEHSIHHETKQVMGLKGEKLYSSHGWSEVTVNICEQWSTLSDVKEKEINCGFHGNVFDFQTLLPVGLLSATRMEVPSVIELWSSCVQYFDFLGYIFGSKLTNVLSLPMTQRKCWTLTS